MFRFIVNYTGSAERNLLIYLLDLPQCWGKQIFARKAAWANYLNLNRRKEEMKIREEEKKLLDKKQKDLETTRGQKLVSFSWVQCWFETIVIG